MVRYGTANIIASTAGDTNDYSGADSFVEGLAVGNYVRMVNPADTSDLPMQFLRRVPYSR